MRSRNLLAGNWKMNLSLAEARKLAEAITQGFKGGKGPMLLIPPFPYLGEIVNAIGGHPELAAGAQHCHGGTFGAFTGEVSAPMLRSLGVDYVLAGHSERRQYFGESDELIAGRLETIFANDLKVIYCCGEPLEIREAGTHIPYVLKQIETALYGLDATRWEQVIIAYEPIWAIGTGLTASPAQAQEMHAEIRAAISAHAGDSIAQRLTLLYGGSAKAANAAELFSQPDIDGGLIGGASLQAEEFLHIYAALK